METGDFAQNPVIFHPLPLMMSRDDVSRIVSYVFGAVALVGLLYFRHLPRPAALDFRAQMAASRLAFWFGIPTSAIVVLAGFFRRERDAKILTIIYGAATLFLWLIITAGNLPVA
jgi:hypothetical protein